MLYLDTNVILRYLLEDSDKFTNRSKDFIENNDVYIKNEVLSEVVYVLNKTYKVPKNMVRVTLEEFLLNTNVHVDSKEVITLSLKIFEANNIDFVDGLLCAYNKILKYNIASFDKKLNKCMANELRIENG